MIIGSAVVIIHVPWVHSLKEKRMVIRSLTAKMRNTFNISVAEVDLNDVHQQIALGFACVVNEVAVADSMVDNVLNYIENNTEGEIVDIAREIR